MQPPIAIIGGGPAGAQAAAELSAAGEAVVVLEERGAWEKPCGGGLTDKALREFPFLHAVECKRNWVTECELTGPDGRRILFGMERPVAIFARRDLNALLLRRAEAAGAVTRQARVVAAERNREGWRVRLREGGDLQASRLVIATGARGNIGGPWNETWQAADLMATAGYYLEAERLPWPRQRLVIAFEPGLAGYIWSFPRGDHASVGICGGLSGEPTAALRRRLETYLERQGVDWRGGAFYGHLLPALRPEPLRQAAYEGDGWARIGDAAGLVDPITGEGLYYALRSGTELAAAWRQAAGRGYSERLQATVLPELERAARMAPHFYRGRFAGGAVLDRMTLFAARSRRFQRLLCDLFSGAQSYTGLRSRLYGMLAPAMWEITIGRGA